MDLHSGFEDTFNSYSFSKNSTVSSVYDKSSWPTSTYSNKMISWF